MNDSEKPDTPYDAPDTPSQDIQASSSKDFKEASLGQRIGAFLIDVAVCIPIAIIPILGFLIITAYFILRDCLPFLDGQSIGKKLLKMRAVNESGESLSGKYSEGVVRNLVLLIPFFSLVELIILITKNGKPEGLRRLGDEWGKTRVIVEG